ncbi:hypothetical protein HNY73_017024 [Argiope bruennichi]|uniref:Uncharacterized protein n=1 Tax=Argiope bruennichi TaxID=94029 RepID=A0A8T0EKQ0_ARGBR|nr:hypothetical protein HNY73_017024 [Argiope bruennichi]
MLLEENLVQGVSEVGGEQGVPTDLLDGQIKRHWPIPQSVIFKAWDKYGREPLQLKKFVKELEELLLRNSKWAFRFIWEPISVQFSTKRSYGTAERRMLPLIRSWASTVHTMQGSAVNYAVIYLGRKLFSAGQAYVALSRVKSLDGLLIEELD